MRIALTQFLSLDGVTQGPGSPTEDTSDGFGRGGWLVPYMDERLVRQTSDWLDAADGLLLGRRTYEAFGRDWPQILVEAPDDPFAERMNSLPKYVVSSSLATGGWAPVTILGGEPAEAVEALKERPGRELQVHGSARLARTLLSAGLVDVVRLVVPPTIVGDGRGLLGHPVPARGLRLVEHDVTSTGVLLLEYETSGTATVATYAGVSDLMADQSSTGRGSAA